MNPGKERDGADGLAGIIALILGGIFFQISYTNLAIVLPLVDSGLHLGGTARGIAVGAFPLGASLLFIPAGLLALRSGTRPILLAGLALLGIAGTLSAFSQNFVELTLLRATAGAGAALFYGPAIGTLATRFAVPRRALMIGLFASVSVAVGATVGFLGGAYLGLIFGWRFVLAVGGLGTLGVAALCAVSVPPQAPSSSPRDYGGQRNQFFEVLWSPTTWCLALGILGTATAAYLAPAFISAFVLAVHAAWGLGYAGVAGAVAFVFTVPGALLGARWSERGRDRRVILLVFAAAFGAFFLLIPVAGRLELLALFGLLGFLYGAALATALTMPSYLPATSGERTSVAIGVIESVEGFARFGGAAAFGGVEVLIGFSGAWWISGLVALGTLPLLLGVPANRRLTGAHESVAAP